jgi:arabinogalactan oligomer/maltooligosaccharide transport system permease protein
MRKAISTRRQIITQVIFVVLGLFVLLPFWAALAMALDGSLDGRNPLHFSFVPREFSLTNFIGVITWPTPNLSFGLLFRNSMIVSLGSALVALGFGLSSAFAFARFRFPGQRVGLFALLLGTLLPPIATMTPLYLMLTVIGIRTTLLGLMVAYTAFVIPFCIWNMRAAFQAIPLEVEQAALIDGAGLWLAFWRIDLPLALPSIAVTALIAFLVAYSEFAIGWLFVERADTVTMAMAVQNLLGAAGAAPRAAALAIVMSLPVILLFLSLRRFLLSGVLLGTVPDEE